MMMADGRCFGQFLQKMVEQLQAQCQAKEAELQVRAERGSCVCGGVAGPGTL
jgi:hypothetical protein